MRQQHLLRSVVRLLPSDHVLHVAYMWTRGWNTYIGGTLAAALGIALATLLGADEWPPRVAVAILLAMPVTLRLTDYRVLAQTTTRMVLLRGGRFRQTAREVIGDVDPDSITPDGGTLLATDWKIDGTTYTVPKSSEKAIQAISLGLFL